VKKFVRTREFEVYAGIAPLWISNQSKYFSNVRVFCDKEKSRSARTNNLRQAINLSILNFAIAVLKYNL
jgi:hypothetical protein